MGDLKKVMNLWEKIEVLRQKLNDVVRIDSLNSEIILELSRQLDVLIVEYYNQSNTRSL